MRASFSRFFQAEFGEVHNIWISIHGLFFESTSKTVSEQLRIEHAFVLVYHFGDEEANIWNVVLHGLLECGHNVLRHLILAHVRNDHCQRVKAADTEVVPFLVSLKRLQHVRDICIDDPVLIELFGKLGTLLDTHLAHCSCSVVQVSHELRFDVIMKLALLEK